MARLILVAASALLLAGCGSAFNPVNWFAGQEEEVEGLMPADAVIARRETRPLVGQVTDVVVERVPGGAIVRARGLTPVPGWHGLDLVAEPQRAAPGVYALSFRGAPPAAPVAGGPNARRVVAATYLSDADLAGVRQIQVAAAANVRGARP